jgi:hypothetical protein
VCPSIAIRCRRLRLCLCSMLKRNFGLFCGLWREIWNDMNCRRYCVVRRRGEYSISKSSRRTEHFYRDLDDQAQEESTSTIAHTKRACEILGGVLGAYLVIDHLNDVLPMFIRMFMSTNITPKQPNNIHPQSPPPQIPIPRPRMHTLPPICLKKPLRHKKPIQSYDFPDFTLAFLAKQVFFDDIVVGCAHGRTEVTGEICGLAILTVRVEEVLEEET